MKDQSQLLLSLAIIGVLAALFIPTTTGCSLTPERAIAICPQVASIAQRTTERVLESNDNPTTRQSIEAAIITLREASRDNTLSFDDLARILTRLPFDQLRNEQTQLIVDAATLAVILLFPDGAQIDVSEHEPARIVAACLADGMSAGLNTPPF